MGELMAGPDPEAAKRGMEAVLKMGKLEIDAIRAAAQGDG